MDLVLDHEKQQIMKHMVLYLFDMVLHVSVEEVIDIGRDKHTYIHGFDILGSVSQNFFLCN